jgi:uncharacterized damage-inducible protein DinB
LSLAGVFFVSQLKTTAMSIIQMLLKEMDQEAQTTRKMLSRIPNDQYQFKPHERSMVMERLAVHIAELPTNNTAELMELFEKSLIDGREHLAKATEEDLKPTWTLRNGETILSVSTKGEVIRMSFSQIVHHRAQLGVYLRLLNIPIPGSYGPSADEQNC